MQTPPLLESLSVTYQVPRNVLVKILLRRVIIRPRSLIVKSLVIISAIVCFSLGAVGELAGFILLGVVVGGSIGIYRAITKAVDSNSQLTDKKTIEFSPSRLVATGPDWKNDWPWTRFNGFSEDADYFYLHLSDVGFASVIPKNAFAPEQQEKFREYAKAIKK
jgi:hypothetical protein